MNRVSLAVALGLSTICSSLAVAADEVSPPPPPAEVTEILPPVGQYDRIYDTDDFAPAELLGGQIEDELGGTWNVPIWDQYSSTARRVYGSGIQLTQESLTTAEQVESVARAFIAEHPALFGNPADADLRTHRITRGLGKWVVLLQQTKEGILVTDAMVNLVITETGRLFAFGSGYYESISVPTTPLIDANAARVLAHGGLAADTDTSRYARPTETQILPMLDTQVDPPQMTFRLAHRIDVPTENPDGLYEVYIDAVSGEILRRVSQTMNSFSGTVTGDVEYLHPCGGSTSKTLPNLELTVDGNLVTTGSDGTFSASGSGSSTYTAKLSGPYVDVETATRLDDNGRHSSIAVDPTTGDISIAFQNFDGRDLYYAKKAGGRWTMELADMRGDSPVDNGDIGEYASVALVGGAPHVAYLQNDAPPRLRYARKTGGTWVWTTETVPDGTINNYGLHASLEMSGSNPMIAYEDAQNSDLRFAYKYSGQWYSEIVESPASGFAGPYASLMLTSTGIPRIAYYSNGDLKYAARGQVPAGYSTSWTISTVDAPGDVGRYASLARDAGGSPLITYYDAGNGDLKFARRPTSTTWQATTIDGAGEDVGEFSSMARASDGTLHVAYYRDDATTLANRALKYSTRSSAGTWQTPVVLEAGNVGQYCSIALDSSDRPRISYFDSQNKRLKLAWHDGTNWNLETVQPQDVELTGPIFDSQSAQIHFQGGAVNWAEIDAFYYANVAYEYAKAIAPEWWPPADMPKATIYVDDDAINSGGKMFPPFDILLRIAEEGFEGPAVSRARVASYVAHEYSHGMAYWLCDLVQPSGLGVAEGNAHIGATFVTDLPYTRDSAVDCDLDGCCGCDNGETFPESVEPTVLCGFNWDLRNLIEDDTDFATAKALTAKLWMGTLANFGYAGYTMPEQVVDYWILDDDNSNVDDGVPHQDAILEAAANHGFTDIIWQNSKKWTKKIAASGLTVGTVPNAVAMDLGPNYKPQIAFIKTPVSPSGSAQSYVYARKPSTTWSAEQVIDVTNGGKSIDLAVLGNGTPVVVYETLSAESEDDVEFRFAKRFGSWVPETFATRTDKVPEGVSMDVGANNEIHVAYGTGELDPLFSPNPKVWYAKKTATAWNVDSTPVDGGALASLDYAAGVIRIAYVGTGQVKYATRVDNATTWSIELISSSPGGPVANTSLIIDTSNNAHACYSVDNTLWYSKRMGTWSTPEIVDQAPITSMKRGLFASIAADAAGYPAISYHDEETGDLRYARKSASGWTKDDVDRPRHTGEYTALRLDQSGNPVIAYFQRTDGQLKVAAGAIAKVPNAYQSSVVPQITRGSGMQAEGGDEVPIVRLCPADDYDQITFQVTLRDVLGAPMNNYALTLVEEDGSVNIVGGGPTGTTNTSGYGEITLSSASGSGWVGICAGGSIMSSFEVRSPDVSGGGGAPANCPLPGGTSVVDSFDITNTECGFDAKSGAVLSDVNRWWDLNGDEIVDSEDEDGWLEGSSMVGGVTQHAAHSGVLGSENTCGGSGKMLAASGDWLALSASPPGGVQTAEPNYTGLLASLKREFAIIPNPATGLARMVWSARAGESARAEIYDVTGRRVRSLRFDQVGAGVRLLEWDGKEASGERASSGVYFARLTSSRGSLVERFTLVR